MPYSPANIPKQVSGRKLSLKDRRFLEFYFEGRPLWECEQHATGGSKNRHYLATAGYERLKKMNIPFEEILEINGLSDHFLASKIKDGLNSTRVGFATFRGKITDTIETPDNPARAKYTEIFAKVKGRFKDSVELTGKGGGDIILQVIPPIRPRDKKEIDI